MQSQKVYINLARNMYKQHPEYNEMIQRLMSGQEFSFANVGGFETKTIAQTANEVNAQGRGMKAKKRKNFD
jgi:hypothetical protein